MYNIIWTEPALNDYHSNIEYLLKEWSEKKRLQLLMISAITFYPDFGVYQRNLKV
jgi:hypothetical protein